MGASRSLTTLEESENACLSREEGGVAPLGCEGVGFQQGLQGWPCRGGGSYMQWTASGAWLRSACCEKRQILVKGCPMLAAGLQRADLRFRRLVPCCRLQRPPPRRRCACWLTLLGCPFLGDLNWRQINFIHGELLSLA